MLRIAAALSRSASSHSPDAMSASMMLAIEHGRVAAVATHDLEAAAPDLDGLAGPSEHHQHVGERDVGDEQVRGALHRFGQVSRLAQATEPLLGAAEVGEVSAEHVEGTDLDARGADGTRHRQCLLARGT